MPAAAARRRPSTLPEAQSAVSRKARRAAAHGGYQTDWVCGGQWNAMLVLLVSALSGLCLSRRRRPGLVVMFPRGLGKDRLAEWGRRCHSEAADSATDRGTRGQQGAPLLLGPGSATGLRRPLREASTHPLRVKVRGADLK